MTPPEEAHAEEAHAEEAHAWLAREGAQRDLVEWALPFGAHFERLWEACPRGDWLLALAARLNVDRRVLVAAACRCVEPALEYVAEDEPRPLVCLSALYAWSRGEASEADWATHREGLMGAHADARDAAGAEALLAFVAALDAVQDASAAAGAGAFAAHASMLATSDCAMVEALRFAQRMQADAVRAVITVSDASTRFRERAGVRRSV